MTSAGQPHEHLRPRQRPGPRGAESERGGYDMTLRCRAGTAATITRRNRSMVGPHGPATVDTISGTNLPSASPGVAQRERTGEPSIVGRRTALAASVVDGHTVAFDREQLEPGMEAFPPGVTRVYDHPLSDSNADHRTADTSR